MLIFFENVDNGEARDVNRECLGFDRISMCLL